MTRVPTAKLSSGYEFPLIGYGTFGGSDGPSQVYTGAKHALESGYRHFDTAYLYNTEEALGKAIKESGIDRNELFITTKLWNNFHEAKHVRPALNMSLENLQMDHVDLYLMHWPISFEFKGYQEASDEMNLKQTHVPIMETWRAMEQLVREGVAHSIGVSNFTIEQLKEILQQCEIPPAVNQIEIHPRLVQQDMVTFCKEHQIVLTAYSPLGNPGYRAAQLKSVDEPKVKQIATKYGKTEVQVLLNWGVNRGYAVIPKSVTPSRINDNFVYFEMDQEDVDAITELGKHSHIRTCSPVALWGDDCDVFGEGK